MKSSFGWQWLNNNSPNVRKIYFFISDWFLILKDIKGITPENDFILKAGNLKYLPNFFNDQHEWKKKKGTFVHST